MDWLTQYGAPHLTWLVVALVVQRERQRWHHAVSRELIGDEDAEDALPGQPGWTYELHGGGVCLHGPDGEALDSDFDDATGAVIDVWFFAARVESVQPAAGWLAEHRLWRWRPSREAIVDGVEQLVGLGAARFAGGGTKVELAPELEARAAEVCEALVAPDASELWLGALEPGGEAAHGEAYRAWLRERVRVSARAGALLDLALAGTTPSEAVELARPLIAAPDWNAGHAVELLRARPDTAPLPEVAELLRRASPDTDHPFAPLHACAYLLERGLDRAFAVERFDAWSQLERASGYLGNPMLAQFALVALDLLPDRAMHLVRLALRSATPICVRQIVEILVAIDQPWCHRELADARRTPRTDDEAGAPELVPIASALRTRYPADWDGRMPDDRSHHEG